MPLRRSQARGRRERGAESPELTDPAAARLAALTLLAGRDYAPQELSERLRGRGFAAPLVELLVGELVAQGALNEARYAEHYIAAHAGRGQGPVRIGAELRKRGLGAELIEAALAARDDWAQLARRLCRAKFGPEPPASWREKARQMRFLQYRGFSADHVRAATGADPDWTEEP